MDSATVVIIIFVAVYILAKMANYAEETKIRAILDEYEKARQRRVRSLYGDEDKDEKDN